MIKRALFLDRDGVINVEKNYLHKIEDFEFIDGVFDTLHYFQTSGYLLIIITNQAGIGRGYYSEDDFTVLNNWMLTEFKKQGITITKVYYSPFHPVHGIGTYKKDSFCRKPNPGMIIQAKDEYGLDLANSTLVGDKESDIEAGINAGIKMNILVRTGYGGNYQESKANYVLDSIRDLLNVIHF